MEIACDPFARRALEQLPELAEQREWPELQTWRRSRGFEDEELTLEALDTFVLGPLLRRLFDRPELSRQPVLRRSFALLEELLGSDDGRAVRTAQRRLEDSVFPRRRGEVAEPFLGARSRAFVASLRRDLGPFEPAWERLKPCLEDVVAAARSRYPGIGTFVRYMLGGPAKFGALASFIYGASQRYEDLLIGFSVTHGRLSPRTRELYGADAEEAVEFYIERGSGQRLGALALRLLPGDLQSPECREILTDYADAAARLLEDRMAAILEALSEPFMPWFPSVGIQRPGRPATSPRLTATPEGREHWRRARDRLEAGYRQVLASLQARSEDIVMDLPDDSAPTSAPLAVSARFTYAGVPDTEVSLTLEFVGAPGEQFWEAEEKEFPVFPDPAGRDAVGFQVLQGARRPTPLGTLRPALLPEDERSPEYASALMAYVERTVAYAASHVEMMLASLATQLQEFRGE